MDKNELTEYAGLLMQAAVRKCDNLADAQDLVQETLLIALVAIKKSKEITDPQSWLITVLNRKYYDMLRQKYRKPTVCIDTIEDIADKSVEDDSLDDAENIRRCLANLTGIYREVMVQYYMNGRSVAEIAQRLGIPENTVKNRLFTGRKHIRKDFEMENYAKQSYEPDDLLISCTGQTGLNGEPWKLVGQDRIAMNLLTLAYKAPLTLNELSKAIGISTTYIEPIVERLVDGQLMKKVSDKVYTDFIIRTEADRLFSLKPQLYLAKELCYDIWRIIDTGLGELKEREFHKAQTKDQAVKLESFFVFRTLLHAVNDVRDDVSGGREPFESYPDRPNGGKWYAMGSLYPHGYDYDNCPYSRYQFNGECVNNLEGVLGVKALSLCRYDTDPSVLGITYKDLYCVGSFSKLVYSIYLGQTEMIEMLDKELLENIDTIIERNILLRDDEGRLKNNIPVISMQDKWDIYELSEKYDNIISEQFHDRFMELMKNPVKLPKHLRSVPEWLRYMECCSCFPSAVIIEARERGLFLKEYDKPAPAIMLCVEK
jgi:RNA polymerase sigma-70 factor (ECF subfamily)